MPIFAFISCRDTLIFHDGLIFYYAFHYLFSPFALSFQLLSLFAGLCLFRYAIIFAAAID